MIDLIALFALAYIVVIALVALAFWVGSKLMHRTRRELAADEGQEDGDARIAV